MYNDPAQGAKLGALLLRYADGSEAELPLRNNVELRDWYLAGAPADPIPAAAEFIAPDLKEFGFYAAELANPHPERELVSIGLGGGAAGRNHRGPCGHARQVTPDHPGRRFSVITILKSKFRAQSSSRIERLPRSRCQNGIFRPEGPMTTCPTRCSRANSRIVRTMFSLL